MILTYNRTTLKHDIKLNVLGGSFCARCQVWSNMPDGLEGEECLYNLHCNCYHLLHRKKGEVYVHLIGCEESKETREYDNLKWYKKLFAKDPRKLLLPHNRP